MRAVGGGSGAAPPAGNAIGVSTDSRAVAAGELFFALRGDSFDGHAFVADALRRGAVAAVVAAGQLEDVRRCVSTALPHPTAEALIAVDDPLAALGRLGAYHRRQLSASVIAVLGSNGKTTTKAMIDCVLSGRLRGRASPRSFNNAIGVPLTLLSAQAGDDYLVVEIGTNAPGEVAALARLAQPDMAVLVSIGEEHLEGLGSLEGVAAEECSVLDALRDDALAIVNIDTPLVRPHLARFRGRRVTFGQAENADLRVDAIRLEPPGLRFRINQRFEYVLAVPGEHNALNAAAAVAVARRLGLEHAEAAERLAGFVSPPMRMQVLSMGGVTVLNDAYNANPTSMLAALETLERWPAARRIAVLGEMRELGRHAAEAHARVGRRALNGAMEVVLLVGAAAQSMLAGVAGAAAARAVRCADAAEAGAWLRSETRAGDVVLVKASRAVELERAVDALQPAAAAVGTN